MREFLTEQTPAADVPPLAGTVTYRDGDDIMAVALVHGYVHGETAAWQHAADNLGIFLDQALASGLPQPAGPRRRTIELAAEQPPQEAQRLIGPYLGMARLLEKRTGEVHVKLASRPEDLAFAPEPFTDFYRQSLYYGLLSQIGRGFELLRGCLPDVDRETSDCERLAAREPEVP